MARKKPPFRDFFLKRFAELNPVVLSLPPLNAEVAQLVERNLAKVEVASSSLVFRSALMAPFEKTGLFFCTKNCPGTGKLKTVLFTFAAAKRGSSSVGRAQPCQG